MYGWRARIGFVAPSRLDTFTYEFYKIAPEGVVMVLSGFALYELVREDIEKAYQNIEESAKDLAKVGVDFIIAAGTPLFTLKGKGSEQEATKRIVASTKIPASTSIAAEIEALKKLSIKKIAIATPHEKERNDLLKKFLKEDGFEVLNIKGLGIRVAADVAKVPSYEVYRLAKEVFLEAPEADGIFIPCPRWPTIGIIDKLEKDLGVPVVTGTTALIWKSFEYLKIKESNKGYGKLLEFK